MRLLLKEDLKGQHIWLLIPYHFEESTSHWLIWTQWRVNFHSTSCLCVCKCTVGKTQETASLIWKCSHKLYHTTLIHVSNSILFEMLEPGDCCFILHCLSVRTPSGNFFHLPLLEDQHLVRNTETQRESIITQTNPIPHTNTHIIFSLHKHIHYPLTLLNCVRIKHTVVSHKQPLVSQFLWKFIYPMEQRIL